MKLSIRNVHKSYNGKAVLSGINLEITASSVGMIGESGCGKSTLLRMLAGIEAPDSGEIFINGISPMKEQKRFQENIGYVFQKHNLFPHLTVRENLLLILEKIRKYDKESAEQTVDAVLKRLKIQNVADQLPNHISGGQAQRASIARALSTNPHLIFLDEPTAALDPVLTTEVLNSVVELKKDGRDFLFVTHEISFLKQFADYVVFLKDGKICESGDISCLSNPKTKELAEFLKNS